MYCLEGIAIGIDLLWRMLSERKLSKFYIAALLGWAVLALAVFFSAIRSSGSTPNSVSWTH
jgi:hypothetical protein